MVMLRNETIAKSHVVYRLNRVAAEDMVINGIPFKKGMAVSFSPLALHHMEEYWENPSQFNPERWVNQTLSSYIHYTGIMFASDFNEKKYFI